MVTENNSAGFDNPTVPQGEDNEQEILDNATNLAVFINNVFDEFFQLHVTDQTGRNGVFRLAAENLADAYYLLVTAIQSFKREGLYPQFVRLRNAYNILNEALHPLVGLTEHVPENYIIVLQPALLDIQQIPIADNTPAEATPTVETAIPEHVQMDSSSDED